MSRNQIAHFAEAPTVDIERSRFIIENTHTTSIDAGKLYPVALYEVLPGDTISLDQSTLCRMSTPLFPVMDNSYLDFYWFFCPNRLVWDHWKQFMGENDSSAWESDTEYFIPKVSAPVGGFETGSVADHFGIPTKVSNIRVNALPLRAYALIYNEWFRNQNLVDPVLVSKGDVQNYSESFHYPLPVARFRDYFSSCLPEPQKGQDVPLPLQGVAPVVGLQDSFFADIGYIPGRVGGYATDALRLMPLGGSSETYPPSFPLGADREVSDGSYHVGYWEGSGGGIGTASVPYLEPYNLGAVFGGSGAVLSTVNDLRQAFAMQRVLELFARGGSRYVEMLRNFFHVIPSDASLQRPEYLGGHHIPININQVLQTSASNVTGSETPLGETGAYSKTVNSGSVFTKSFTEHGYLIGLCCLRTDRTFQQGLHKLWSRDSFYDFYLPQLAHVGEMPVRNIELYAQGNSLDDEVFGYNEAWVEYKTQPNYVTGLFRHNADGGSLDAWTYADYYDELPTLSAEWLAEGTKNVDRTLAVQSTEQNPLRDYQFYLNMYFKLNATRPMPMYSIPGLIDHF